MQEGGVVEVKQSHFRVLNIVINYLERRYREIRHDLTHKQVNSHNIIIGHNSGINEYSVLEAGSRSKIIIGNNVQIGSHTVIVTLDHIYLNKKKTIMNQGHIQEDITIGNDIWIGARVTILRGSHIPDGCVIGACSLVTRHDVLKPNCVYVGNPLKKINKRR
jgi:acetyltransferase-like isoleucine patch superfamily enzyme